MRILLMWDILSTTKGEISDECGKELLRCSHARQRIPYFTVLFQPEKKKSIKQFFKILDSPKPIQDLLTNQTQA